jgi:hypothetical protein
MSFFGRFSLLLRKLRANTTTPIRQSSDAKEFGIPSTTMRPSRAKESSSIWSLGGGIANLLASLAERLLKMSQVKKTALSGSSMRNAVQG